MNQTPRSTTAMLLAAALLLPALLVAQWQVNPQVNRGGAPAYGNGSVKYSTSLMANNASYQLPSQNRYAAFTSGALPSELKMNYNAIGPLAPSGAMAYIPPAPNYRSSQVTSGNYMAPAPSVAIAPMPAPAPSASSWSTGQSSGWNSVRYSPTPGVAPTPGMTSYPSASPFSGIQASSVSNSAMMGSVKYSQ